MAGNVSYPGIKLIVDSLHEAYQTIPAGMTRIQRVALDAMQSENFLSCLVGSSFGVMSLLLYEIYEGKDFDRFSEEYLRMATYLSRGLIFSLVDVGSREFYRTIGVERR